MPISSVTVKKEWLPIVFDNKTSNEDETVPAEKKGMSFLSCMDLLPDRITLSFINTTTSNIDLLSAMFGPVIAGWILEMLGFDGGSLQRGFVAIALFNAVSFLPEIYLLRKVYRSCPALQIRRGESASESGLVIPQPGGESEDSPNKTRGQQHNNKSEEEDLNPWQIWSAHPSGLPLLTLSLASLYLTALCPDGVVLTSYLITIGLSPSSIGVFRGIGAIAGVVGICSFSLLRKNNDGDAGPEDRDGRAASVKSIELLRGLSLAFLLLEVVSVLVAAASYALVDTSHMISSAPSSLTKSGEPLSWPILIFLGAIVVSRAGLYSFDVGVLEIEQYLVDERYRNAVGSVEGALCSLCEMGMYVLSIALPNPSQFGWQVGVSATAVSFGGVCFSAFLCLYHMHQHTHHHHEEDDDNGHSHGHHHHHEHKHTLQQERDLKEFGYHIHLHRHRRPLRAQRTWSNLRLES